MGALPLRSPNSRIPSAEPSRSRALRPTHRTLVTGAVIGVVLFLLLASLGALGGSFAAPSHAGTAASPRVASARGAVVGSPAAIPQHRLATVSLQPGPAGSLPTTPSWLAYDHGDQSFYVAVAPSSVDVVNGAFNWSPVVNLTVPVGSDPFGVAYDNASGNVFVTNSGSNNVSVLNGYLSYPIWNTPVGSAPTGIAYDPVNHYVYVANNGSANVSVIGANLTVIDTIAVGTNPIGVAVDPVTGNVFVANYGSNNVTVISGSTNSVIANVSVDTGPYGVAVDNATGNVYVTDQGTSNVSVISGSSFGVIANISVGSFGVAWQIDLQGIAYDPGDGYLWVGGGHNPLVVINPANESILTVLTFDPSGVAYDPDTGDVCVTNTANTTFECAQFLGGSPSPDRAFTFQESGLPLNQNQDWSVTLGDNNASGFNMVPGTIQILELPNATVPYQFSVSSVGSYFPSPASGNVTLGPNGTTVNITYSTGGTLYPVLFVENGLPYGTAWTVTLGGVTKTSTIGNGSLEFEVPNGTYVYFLGGGRPGYAPPADWGWAVVNGDAPRIVLAYSGPAWYFVTFNAQGLPNGTNWSVGVNGSWQYAQAPTDTLEFGEPNGSYGFTTNGNGTYAATTPFGSLQIAGGDLIINLSFVRVTTYSVVVTESGLPANSTWAVNVSGRWDGTTSTSLTVWEPNGTYWYVVLSPPGPPYYSPNPNNGSFTVVGASVAVNITFVPQGQVYPVTFDEAGLPSGTPWSVGFDGATGSSSNSSVQTFAPNGTYPFQVGNVSGYSASPGSGWLNISGAPVAVSITFSSTGLYPVYLVESGLPNGSAWSAALNGTSLSSTTDTILFSESNGSYSLSVPSVANYTVNYTNPVVVQGASLTVAVVFSNTTYPVTFEESGLATGALWTVTAVNRATGDSTVGDSTTNVVTLHLANGQYDLTASGPVGYRISLPASVTVNGASPSTVTVSFTGPSTGGSGATPLTLPLVVEVAVITAVLASLAGAWGYSTYRYSQRRAEGEQWVKELRSEGQKSDDERTR